MDTYNFLNLLFTVNRSISSVGLENIANGI